MDRLVFHEDETGIGTLHDLVAFQFFPEYPSACQEAFGELGVWSPIRENTGLGSLGITPAELGSLMPISSTRIEHVLSYYGPPENLSRLPAIAFALDPDRAILADISHDEVVTSIWILDHSADQSWVRLPLLKLSERWPLLMWDDYFDLQFPLARVDRLDAWLAALKSRHLEA